MSKQDMDFEHEQFHRQLEAEHAHHHNHDHGDKVTDIQQAPPLRQKLVLAVISLAAFVIFAFTVIIAIGVANVSPSPAAQYINYLLILGLLMFAGFVIFANILFNRKR
ncbi:hypothetical protein KDA_31880 [Dictyobacter alpinus]|uniref:Uncharacterized protein n=1 Tax=Dictyobacter alpinus TaxID=2014873 RepID=A0A402B8K2_9CHLR|nr:hypothetical protein [Dictyobacter alpinus]GCE27704.1 hypothetical protein KDA_31880 [Dictyobacter alpinus]